MKTISSNDDSDLEPHDFKPSPDREIP